MIEKERKPSRVIRFPSKVLLAGGYSVLQASNQGLVIALENYFYSFYLDIGNIDSETMTNIEVLSPQIDGKWKYQFDLVKNELKVIQLTSPNNFVQSALKCSIEYFNTNGKCVMPGRSFKIYLLFDRGFISQQHLSTIQAKFLNYYSSLIKKTGLGSSACVTVAIVSMICLINGRLYKQLVNSQLDKQLVNCLSHISNLLAQRKIGSNFDISAAVFGTQLYTNVLPGLAMFYLDSHGQDTRVFTTSQQIKQILNPSQFYLYLLDLQHGSDTRTMVGSFMKQLNNLSQQLRQEFLDGSSYIVTHLAQAYKNKDMVRMKELNNRHRILQQKFSKLTKVEIEPEDLRTLLDNLQHINNVVYVICPGSGGFDAICIITLDPLQPIHIAQISSKAKLKQFKTSDSGMNQATQKEIQQVLCYLKL